MQDRNVFAIHGHMAIVTRYHKSASQYDQPEIVPRFLAWRVGQPMAMYLAYARPLQESFAGANTSIHRKHRGGSGVGSRQTNRDMTPGTSNS